MKKIKTFIIFFLVVQTIKSQVTLDADGTGNTYELITSVLAPNHNPIEVPDCNHSQFGDHIRERFDSTLNTNVFEFHVHVSPDNDRCRNFDRQRNEIKSYDRSPDNLLGIKREVVEYKWKFKLNNAFSSSSSFTHLHQLKAVGGSEAGMPLITLTTRKSGSNQKLQLRYASNNNQITIAEEDLSPLIGKWVEVTEVVKYGEKSIGTYSIIIKRISDNKTLFRYSNSNIRMWKTDADFIRPKWGVYRSLNSPNDLRDEIVLFANFKITEIETLDISSFERKEIKTFPNPVKDKLSIHSPNNTLETAIIYNLEGKIVKTIKFNTTHSYSINTSKLKPSIYFIQLKTHNNEGLVRKIIKK